MNCCAEGALPRYINYLRCLVRAKELLGFCWSEQDGEPTCPVVRQRNCCPATWGEHPIARVCHTVCSVLTKSKSGSLRTQHLCTSQEVEGAFHELRDIEKDLVLDFPDCQSAQTLAAAAVSLCNFTGSP